MQPTAIAAMFCIAWGAMAETAFVTGNKLYGWCSTPRNTNEKTMCQGYIGGVADSMATNVLYSARACLPPGVTLNQATDIVVKTMKMFPEDRHKSADYLVSVAMAAAFPCK